MEKRLSLANASIKDVDCKKGIVTGYFAAFDNVDSDGDVIRKGAFTKTIAENMARIKHLLNHDSRQPIGKIQVLLEDEKGLYYESQIGSHAGGKDFLAMVESDLITEHSIGYKTIKRNQLQDFDGYKMNPSGGWYELTELKLYEGSSLTAWGANSNTPLTGLKECKDADERINLLMKAIKDGNFTDATFRMLEMELQQIRTTQAAKALEPNNEAEKEILKQLKKINQKWK